MRTVHFGRWMLIAALACGVIGVGLLLRGLLHHHQAINVLFTTEPDWYVSVAAFTVSWLDWAGAAFIALGFVWLTCWLTMRALFWSPETSG